MAIEQWVEILKVSGAIVALVGLVAGLIWNQHREVSGMDAKNESRIKRVYERIDEEKEKTHEHFVTKEVCGILHKQLLTDLAEIKTDVKTILRKNGFKHE